MNPAEPPLSIEGLAELRHALRTPLNHLIGYSEMLMEDEACMSDPDCNAALKQIRSRAEEILECLHGMAAREDPREVDLKAFRMRIAGPLTYINNSIAVLSTRLNGDPLADALRMNSAAGELLGFVEGKQARPSAASRIHLLSEGRPAHDRSGHLLIVDDNEGNRDMLRRQVERLGYTAMEAASGGEALEMLRSGNFDAVLLDLMMPGINGMQVLEVIQEDETLSPVPVMVLSALDQIEGASRCIEMGAEDYLFKPVSAVLLRARLHATIERKRLWDRERLRARELEDLSRELKQANEELKRFAYVASHDLQAPLRTVVTQLQLLDRKLGNKLEREDRQFVSYAIEGARRMRDLIRDLLTYYQLSTKERKAEPVSSEEVLTEVVENLAASVVETGAAITHDPLPVLLADRIQIVQLFQNLIGNALKYRSEQPPKIHVSASDEGSSWRFLFSDNGLGIEPRYREHIFEMFRRLHSADFPGTGIGLAICQRVVEQLGGRIWVESTLGEGSTFFFTVSAAHVARGLTVEHPA
ncbi:MAG: response regulator [Bryobacteraceae bacterium]